MNPIIRIVKASKSYTPNLFALNDVSMAVEPGDVYGIIGLSGAGKSTLIRAIAKLLTLSSGNIFFQNTDIALMGKNELRDFRKKIGMIFQHFNLLSSRTVRGNIAYPMEVAGVPAEEQNKRIDALLELVSLGSKGDCYPETLSGGEKQRVGIARALANHPQVVLCDEATSALDPKTTKEILKLLQDINKKLGVTIILITHEMEVIKQICNKVAVIENGRLVEEGPVAEIFFDPQHVTTKNFLHNTSHEIPEEFFQAPSPNRLLLRLKFKGQAAGEPIMSEIVRKFNVDINILLGWIDHLQNIIIGTLIIELTGMPEGIAKALGYLLEKSVHYEVMTNEP